MKRISVKEQVLRLLKQNTSESISGQQIAEELGVSRAAVWKAVQKLRESGCRIEGTTNRGYFLADDRDILSAGAVAAALGPEAAAFCRVEYMETAGSTNTLLKERAASGEPEGAVGIKWVNDLFLSGRKICGILTEGMLSFETGGLDYCVLGVGFNIAAPEEGWPEELRGIAGNLPEPVPRAALAAAFLNRFLPFYRSLPEKNFLPEYRKRQILPGRTVEVLRKGSVSEALALGIDDDCRLLVRYPDGSEERLTGGEVRARGLS